MDLEIKFCSCGKFQESGFPCAHAAAYLISAGKNPHNYCHESAYGAYVKRMYHQDKNYRSTVLTDLLSAANSLGTTNSCHFERSP